MYANFFQCNISTFLFFPAILNFIISGFSHFYVFYVGFVFYIVYIKRKREIKLWNLLMIIYFRFAKYNVASL